MKQYLKRKWLLLVALTLTLIVLFQIDRSENQSGVKVVIGGDTCAIKYRNNFTGNYRVVSNSGKEFSVKPHEINF